ncbi:hypothetical protein ACFE04_030194 [Oxalis oulophora]
MDSTLNCGHSYLVELLWQNFCIVRCYHAIRKRNFVNILDIQGSPDLSAYVDFSAIKHSAEEASETVSVYGLMTQLNFFGSLGINFRVEVLLQNCTDEQVDSMRT